MNINSMKGNAAEYLVLHYLLKNEIPAWHTGGNNRRWDLIIQTGNNKLCYASVKFAKTRLPIFTERDEVISKGIYFVVVPKKDSEDWEILLFDSRTIATACKRYLQRAKNTISFKDRPTFRNFRIGRQEYEAGLANVKKMIKSWKSANTG